MSNTESPTLVFDQPWQRLTIATVFALMTLLVLVIIAMGFAEHDDIANQIIDFDGYLYQPENDLPLNAFLLERDSAGSGLSENFTSAMHGEHWVWFSPKQIDETFDILQIDLAWLDRVSIYYITADGRHLNYEAGDEYPFNQRVIPFRKPAFPLLREISQGEVQTIALRIGAQGRFSLPLFAFSEKAFNLQANLDYLFYGAWIAILISLGFYNGTIFFILRSNVHLYYFIYILVFTALLVTASGIGQQYLWPNSKNLTTLLANISLAFTNYGTAFFVIHFIQLEIISGTLTSVLKWLAYISLLCVPLVFIFHYDALTPILLGSFIIMALILPAAVYATLKGNEVAPFLLASLVVLLPCNTIGLIRFMGFFENLHWMEHLPELGLVADALILSLALAYKVHLLRGEKDTITNARETERIAYAKQIMHVKEEERKAIGKALHDELGHKVLAIKSSVQAISEQDNGSYKSNSLAMLDEAIKEVRDLSHLLYPSIIEHIGLEKAISGVVSKGLYTQDIELTVDIPVLHLDSEIALLLYRAAQEFVNNIIKHSNASAFLLKVSALKGSNEIIMTATDNGDTLFTAEDFGFGLSMLKQQAALFNGDLAVQRTHDGFNKITLNIFVLQ